MTVRRYHPHALQKQLRDLPSLLLPETGSLHAETLYRARWWWEDPIVSSEPSDLWPAGDSPYLQAPPGGLAEFGQDATRLAGLTAPEGSVPDLDLLASTWRWLAGFYEAFVGWRGPDLAEDDSCTSAWDPRPWIQAGATARDHLLRRSRVYPGLAVLRKAWKEAPITPSTPLAGKRLALLLLIPFAPVLMRVLGLDKAIMCLTDRGLSRHLSAFPPWKPVCITLSRGGRRWEALDQQGLDASPYERLAELPFLAATLRDCTWKAQPVSDGWLIELQGRGTG